MAFAKTAATGTIPIADMTRIIWVPVFPTYLGLLAHPALAEEKRFKIYDKDYQYQMQVDGNRVLDKNYKTK
jgi:hypothetical protein